MHGFGWGGGTKDPQRSESWLPPLGEAPFVVQVAFFALVCFLIYAQDKILSCFDDGGT